MSRSTYDQPVTDDPVETMWQLFQDATGVADTYSAWAFGDDSDPDFQTTLGELVLKGPKRATAGLLSDYSSDDEPVPEVGGYSIILDGDGSPLCIIRTAEVRIKPMSEVDEQFAWDEGEGDRTLKWWTEAHVRFFAHLGIDVGKATEMVLERFELVWPAA